jgi:hypothetical protein
VVGGEEEIVKNDRRGTNPLQEWGTKTTMGDQNIFFLSTFHFLFGNIYFFNVDHYFDEVLRRSFFFHEKIFQSQVEGSPMFVGAITSKLHLPSRKHMLRLLVCPQGWKTL